MARAGGAARSLNQLRGVHRSGEKVVIITCNSRASLVAIRAAAVRAASARIRIRDPPSGSHPRGRSGVYACVCVCAGWASKQQRCLAVSPFFPAASNESERDRARPTIVRSAARGRGEGASPSRAWVCVPE